jgi:hypothetical protein
MLIPSSSVCLMHMPKLFVNTEQSFQALNLARNGIILFKIAVLLLPRLLCHGCPLPLSHIVTSSFANDGASQAQTSAHGPGLHASHLPLAGSSLKRAKPSAESKMSPAAGPSTPKVSLPEHNFYRKRALSKPNGHPTPETQPKALPPTLKRRR